MTTTWLLLALALPLAAGAEKKPVDSCDACVYAVDLVSKLGEKGGVVIKTHIDDLCKALAPGKVPECKEYLTDEVLEKVVKFISSLRISPKTTCEKYFRVCHPDQSPSPTAEAERTLDRVTSKPTCGTCILTVAALEAQISKSSTQEKVAKVIKTICATNLNRSKCVDQLSLVAQLVLDNVSQNGSLSPLRICQDALLCPAK